MKSSITSIPSTTLTQGGVGGDGRARLAEQECAARMLKAKLYWGGFNDTGVSLSRELIRAVEARIEAVKPDMVFVNHAADTHQDHRNVSQAVEKKVWIKKSLYSNVTAPRSIRPA